MGLPEAIHAAGGEGKQEQIYPWELDEGVMNP